MGRMREAFIGGVNPGVDIFAAAAALVGGLGSMLLMCLSCVDHSLGRIQLRL